MKQYHHRIFQLLKLLGHSRQPLSGRQICQALAIGPRTLREDISRYKESLAEEGVELVSRHGIGYQLLIHDENKYHALVKSMLKLEHRQHFIAPLRYEERVNYIIRALLSADDYQKLDELADEIFISRSTLNNCMKEVRRALAAFHLDLAARPGSGVKIAGNELNIRQAIARYFFYDDRQPVNTVPTKGVGHKIRALLVETLGENGIQLTDIGLQNLVVHLEIALMRIGKNPDMRELPADYQRLKTRPEYHVAAQLAIAIEKMFAVAFPEIECCYVAIHLAGKRYFGDNEPVASRPDVMQLFDKILQQIDRHFAVSLAGDFELYHLLSLHFTPMMDRLYWKLSIHNSLLEQIKAENITAWEMALLAGKIIQQESGLEVNEAEMGYLAVHFALALDRLGSQHRRYNLLIVCASGMGSSQLLLYRIRQRFAEYLNQIRVVQLYELKQLDHQGFDLILSTVDIPFPTSVPLLRINHFPEPQDLQQMADWMNTCQRSSQHIDDYFSPTLFFTDLRATERFALIEEFCQRVAVQTRLDDAFTAAVIEREKLSSTGFGNGVAFPHPFHPVGDRTFVAVAVLAHAVRWERQEVRYLFMLNIRREENHRLQGLYESLTSLMADKQRLKTLRENPSFAVFSALLRQRDDCDAEPLSGNAFK